MKKMLIVVSVALMLASPLVWGEMIHLPGVKSSLVKWEYQPVLNFYNGVQTREAEIMLVFDYYFEDGLTKQQTHYIRHPELRWSDDFRRVTFKGTLCATRHWYGLRHRGCKLSGETTSDGFLGEFTE